MSKLKMLKNSVVWLWTNKWPFIVINYLDIILIHLKKNEIAGAQTSYVMICRKYLLFAMIGILFSTYVTTYLELHLLAYEGINACKYTCSISSFDYFLYLVSRTASSNCIFMAVRSQIKHLFGALVCVVILNIILIISRWYSSLLLIVSEWNRIYMYIF